MGQRDPPPVDEDDPSTPAVEVNPEKIDLERKPRRGGPHESHPRNDPGRGNRPAEKPEPN
jgi:hypothetical protein